MAKTTEEIEAMNRFNNLDRKTWYSEKEVKKMQREIVELKEQLLHCFDKDEYRKYIEEKLRKQAEEILILLRKNSIYLCNNNLNKECNYCRIIKHIEQEYLDDEKK